jgi:D-threo-aldose 1-dehydrogenase
VVAAGPFNGGMLARGERSGWRFNYRPAPPGVIAAYERLVDLATETGTELKAAAIQFPLRHPDVVSLVIGAASAAEVEENLAAAQREVPASFWSALP